MLSHLKLEGIRKIADVLKVSKSTVQRIVSKYKDEGVEIPAKRPGRPKLMDERDKRHLARVVEKNPIKPLTEIQQDFNQSMKISVSISTLRRELHLMGYYGFASCRKPWISKVNQINRLKWTRARKQWADEWKNVIWSDESRYKLFKSDGRFWTWRKMGHRYDCQHLIPTVKYGGGSVMVWACFSWWGLGPIVVVDGILNQKTYKELLEKHKEAIQQACSEDGDFFFQQDNAPCHKTNAIKKWMEENEVRVLPWPAQSPDLSPIEPLWDVLERRIRARNPHPKSLSELRTALKEEWHNIPESVYRDLVESMPRRVATVIASKGMPTRY